MAGMGSVYRIRECALELLAMEEDLLDSDEESWELVGKELRLKSTFLYCDLSQVIRGIEDDDHKRSFTELTNKVLYHIDEPPSRRKLGKAVKNQSSLMAQVCHNDTAQVLQDLIAALPPSPWMDRDANWEMDENEES